MSPITQALRSSCFFLDRAWRDPNVSGIGSEPIKMERGKENEKIFSDKYDTSFFGRVRNDIRAIE
jgi:hypothetical protein